MPVTVKIADGDEVCACGEFGEEHCIICGDPLCDKCYSEYKTCVECTI